MLLVLHLRNLHLKQDQKDFSLLYIYVSDPFQVNLLHMTGGMDKSLGGGFAYGYPLVPKSFAEKTFLPPLNHLGTRVRSGNRTCVTSELSVLPH